MLRSLARDLRDAEWDVTAVLEMGDPVSHPKDQPRLLDLLPGDQSKRSYGVAIDIGTTSNVVYLVDLLTGRVLDRASAYNAQISAGEDVISRIIFSQKRDGLQRLQKMVLKTLNGLLDEADIAQPDTIPADHQGCCGRQHDHDPALPGPGPQCHPRDALHPHHQPATGRSRPKKSA